LNLAVNDIGDIELPDSSGRMQRLGELWADGAHMLLFLRHFG
jgi:hypothetical protein